MVFLTLWLSIVFIISGGGYAVTRSATLNIRMREKDEIRFLIVQLLPALWSRW